MFSSNSRPKFYDDPTAINLLKAMSKSVSIISGHPLVTFKIKKTSVSVVTKGTYDVQVQYFGWAEVLT